MEASALQAPVALSRQRSTIGLAVLRLRSDEQLVALLRSGHDEAFQAIHDRYCHRLFAYVRQMLPLRQDAEDALQEVFERAYASLRAGDRDLALRPWLYRVAHNRCIDHLRRPAPPPPEAMLTMGLPSRDPVTEADSREALRRLLADVRQLPDHQRSALLMRELGGISYADVAQVLGVTVPAVKSLLVRARVSLAAAGQARDAACEEIRAELVMAHEGRVRPNSMARRHLRDCPGCRDFRGNLRGMRRGLLAAAPALGPCGLLARLLGGGGTGSAAGGGAAAACGGVGASGAAGMGGLLASAGAVVSGAGHVATLLAATMVTAGGAAAIGHPISSTPHHHHARANVRRSGPAGPRIAPVAAPAAPAAPPPVSEAPARVVILAARVISSHLAEPVASTRVSYRGGASGQASDNSLGPIPDPPAPQATAAGTRSTPPGMGAGSPSDAAAGTPTPTPSAGNPPSSGGGTGPGGSAPPPATPTPAGGSGGSQPPVGITPDVGTPTPTPAGGTSSPPATDSGTPSTPGGVS